MNYLETMKLTHIILKKSERIFKRQRNNIKNGAKILKWKSIMFLLKKLVRLF